ncbi:MAG: hypothetical protein V1839_02860 [archaeon]
MKNKILLAGVMLATFLISIGAAHAFGVSAPYWSNYPLNMYAGETKTINFNLQNTGADATDETVKVILIRGSEVATLDEDTYFVKAGTSDTMAPVTISVPEGGVGTYKVALEFKTVSSGAGGGVAMGVGMNEGFDVIATERPAVAPAPQPVSMSYYFSVFLIVLMTVVIVAAVLRKRKKKGR